MAANAITIFSRIEQREQKIYKIIKFMSYLKVPLFVLGQDKCWAKIKKSTANKNYYWTINID